MTKIYTRTEKKILPLRAQIVMDSNANNCFNCIYFKLVKTYSIRTRDEYLCLKAVCTNREAIGENGRRGNPIALQNLLAKPGKLRINCKFFKLG